MPIPSRFRLRLPQRRAQNVPQSPGTFRVLTVCTGNICRSPQAEQLLRKRIPLAFGRAEIDALAVSSAGTQAADGAPMERYAIEEAVRLGVDDTAAHVAQRLRRAHAAEADLIITMTCAHRDSVVAVLKQAAPKTFTLVEFTRIVEALADGSAGVRVAPLGADGFASFMRRVTAAAHAARASVPPPRPAMLLDIPDPYGFAPEVYRRSAESIDEHATRVADALAVLAARELQPR